MNTKIRTKTIKLGRIGVDSATMMFCDPCYVIAPDSPVLEQMKKLGTANGVVEDDVALMVSGFGDGAYEVEIEEGDFGKWGKKVVSAKITFIQPKECA